MTNFFLSNNPATDTSCSVSSTSFTSTLRSMHFCTLLISLTAFGCSNDKQTPPAKSEKPAKIEAHPTEADIYRVVLAPKAEERLQISVEPVRRQSVPRYRTLGGDVMIPDGAAVQVTAAIAGTLVQVDRSPIVVAGRKVTAKQPLLSLVPLLRPEQEVPTAAERVQMANARASLVSAQIQATGEEKQAQAQVDGAEIALNRVRKLLADKAGSQRQVDDAEAALNIAQKGLEASTERRRLLDKLTLEAESGTAPTISIEAPQDGIVQTVSAQPGQVVSAGAPLFAVVDLKKMWIRVPVYAGLVAELNSESSASVQPLSSSAESVPASPVAAPPTATPLSASIDLYYQIDNANGRFRPGERVSVNVPILGEAESLVVPRAAVLLDIHGTSWVYVKSGQQQYQRARVAVRHTTSDLAVLSLGPEVGTEVVVDGAAELFGTEFGAGK